MVDSDFISVPLLDLKQFDILLKNIPPPFLFLCIPVVLPIFGLELIPFFIEFFFFRLGWSANPIGQIESVLTTLASINGFACPAV